MGVVDKPTKSMLNALGEEVELLTCKVTLAECVSEPLVPVMVRVELPAGLLPLVVTVSVALAPGAMEVGLNEVWAPVGRPLAVKFTVEVNPFNAPIVTV
jgi:hypothetical protein